MIGIARCILDTMLLANTRLTNEILTTLMAEIADIMNARPLVPISSDCEKTEILTPAMLLTQKACATSAPPGKFNIKDMYKSQWKQVQNLAYTLWKRWKQEYLSTLQTLRKWTDEKPNVQEGDVVLLKDPQVKCNECPMGFVTKIIPSADGKVCKLEVKAIKQVLREIT